MRWAYVGPTNNYLDDNLPCTPVIIPAPPKGCTEQIIQGQWLETAPLGVAERGKWHSDLNGSFLTNHKHTPINYKNNTYNYVISMERHEIPEDYRKKIEIKNVKFKGETSITKEELLFIDYSEIIRVIYGPEPDPGDLLKNRCTIEAYVWGGDYGSAACGDFHKEETVTVVLPDDKEPDIDIVKGEGTIKITDGIFCVDCAPEEDHI